MYNVCFLGYAHTVFKTFDNVNFNVNIENDRNYLVSVENKRKFNDWFKT